jgi:hypothetical protein
MALDPLTRARADIAWLIGTICFSALVYVSVHEGGSLHSVFGRAPPSWACVGVCLGVSVALRTYFRRRHWR